MRFFVVGSPAPQGSKRAITHRSTGRPVVIEQQNTRVKSWRQAVIDAVPPGARQAPEMRIHPLPVAVTLAFLLPRPKAHYLTGGLSPTAPARPAKMPDLDKLCRSTLDALTAAGCWRDDSQVVDLNASKLYCRDGEPPGAVIIIERAEDE